MILMEAMMDVPSNVVRETFSWQIPEMEDHGDVSVRMKQDPIKLLLSCARANLIQVA